MGTKHSIIFGIICFREHYWETQSYRDLTMSYDKDISHQLLDILIFDNTDYNNWNDKEYVAAEGVNIHYNHNKDNPGISAAVNYFADIGEKKGFKWLVILDQDTALPPNFYDVYASHINREPVNNIAFPRVYSRDMLMSPSGYKLYRTKKINIDHLNSIRLDYITGINSGLLINIKFLRQTGGYNSLLKVDFCDHEWIERINFRNFSADILNIKLMQDFSEETNNFNQSLVRYKIYLHDMKIYRENKNKLIFFLRVDLPHVLKLTYKYLTLQFLKYRFFS